MEQPGTQPNPQASDIDDGVLDVRVAIQQAQRQQTIDTFRSVLGSAADVVDVGPDGSTRIEGCPVAHRAATGHDRDRILVGRDLDSFFQRSCYSPDDVLSALADHEPSRIRERARRHVARTWSGVLTTAATSTVGFGVGVVFWYVPPSSVLWFRILAVLVVVGSVCRLLADLWSFARRTRTAEHLHAYASDIETHRDGRLPAPTGRLVNDPLTENSSDGDTRVRSPISVTPLCEDRAYD